MMKKGHVRIRPITFIMLLWMILTDRAGIGAVTLIAALLHEGGHMVAAKLMHVPISMLRMDFLGARLDVSGRVLSYGEEWLLCAAGPIASFLSSALASFFWNVSTYAVAFSCASFVLGFLNLLPIRTFDGGRMLESMLLFFVGERSALCIMRGCTFFFLFLLWAAAVYLLLRAGDGISLLFFSMSLFSRFFEGETDHRFIFSK